MITRIKFYHVHQKKNEIRYAHPHHFQQKVGLLIGCV